MATGFTIDLRTRQVKHFTQASTGLDDQSRRLFGFRDSRGQLWIGAKMGICRYDDVSQTITCAFGLGHNSDVVDICEDAHGHL